MTTIGETAGNVHSVKCLQAPSTECASCLPQDTSEKGRSPHPVDSASGSIARLSHSMGIMEKVSESLETQLLRGDLSASCPRCGYDLWLRVSEVVTQIRVTCSCCHLQIQLVDAHGSTATAGRIIESAVNKAFDGLS